MPEGPELYLSSLFINRICRGLIFSGSAVRNPIHKCLDIAWNEPAYTISAESRGKELMLHLRSCSVDSEKPPSPSMKDNVLSILFTFGMSGKFEFAPADDMPKHSHLTFLTRKEPKMGLAFVDYRRFGKWIEKDQWSVDRGPCVIQEHTHFINNVAANLDNNAFNKPICEVMLNQKFFNGIGNYLRAEILFRCKIAPFEKAISVLKPKEPKQETKKECEDFKANCKTEEVENELHNKDIHNESVPGSKTRRRIKKEAKAIKVEIVEGSSTDDIYDYFTLKGKELLKLCGSIPLEVINIGSTKYSLSELYKDDSNGLSFNDWLQCYYQEGMKNMVDHNKRTIWFSGPSGPMTPKEQKSRGKAKAKTKKDESKKNEIKSNGNEKESSMGNVQGNDKKSSTKTLTRKKLKELKSKMVKTHVKEEIQEIAEKAALNEASHSRKRKKKISSDLSVEKKKTKRNEPKQSRSTPKRLTRSSMSIER